MTHNRPALQFAPKHLAVLVLFFVAALVALRFMSATPENRVEQVFYGPVNAPVNTCLSADQKADVRGEVRR